ncbi:hypothetical protein IscW_ISCW001297 [Ixodes scapularis]|uniref:Uncharacterized protein n=1 Tax=Ixodes scapularis TaxID=6945 RepID=B7P5C8_IXOSC|nr:hypothetical protein IscW_ISCW001297 [Ixodes scapularis]|eukprot:XP_002407242.1 hypothetical protein IscW_ISCW001297 [Ixodes scapularis]
MCRRHRTIIIATGQRKALILSACRCFRHFRCIRPQSCVGRVSAVFATSHTSY